MKTLAALVIALMPALALAQSAVPQAEQFDVATLKPQYPHRLFVLDPYGTSGVAILNGDTLAIEGSIPTGLRPVLALNPDGSAFYVCESIWTRGNRGARQDILSVYDSRTLNLLDEISLPAGRLLSGSLTHDCDVSAGGKLVYVYNMQPASSVTVVNVEQRRVVSDVELPGCALAFPWGGNGFSSLCGDGSVATVPLSPDGKPGRITHTARFFDADEDPIFSESLVDRSTGRAFFLSYTGLIYPAQLKEHPLIEKPWSLQAAAGLPVAGTGVQELAWRPGGSRMIAWHKAKSRLYVLMHMGPYWTHADPGTEVWVLDIPSHTVLKRVELTQPAISIAVSQDSEPLLYLLIPNSPSSVITLDPETGQQKAKRTTRGESVAWVPGF